MGTNYYWIQRKNVCQHCNRADETEQHIGKSSGGWCFTLHVYPEDSLHDLPDWEVLFAQPSSIIRDEYGKTVTVKEMLEIITDRSWKTRMKDRLPSGYTSWKDFHNSNHSEPGPKGLLRHRIETDRATFVYDTNGCIAHGKGTWDCVIGDFC